jgi:hypothetical protein
VVIILKTKGSTHVGSEKYIRNFSRKTSREEAPLEDNIKMNLREIGHEYV